MVLTAAVEGEHVTPSIRLSRLLGSGGMGSVWIADHLTLHTQVVVKFLAASLVHDEVSRGRFSREAAAASQVKSPHVVQTLDHGVTESGLPFIVMELLDGESLSARLLREGKLEPPEAARIIGQVCRALTRAHERGIVHRDIKPDNIFLCHGDDGEPFVKVLDFGIAKHPEQAESGGTVTGQAIGTPAFMSPEQLVGAKDLDRRSDLWSVGVLTFLLLTGVRPFPGGNIGAVALAVHSSNRPKPSAQNNALPPAVDAWFEKACAHEPEARFQSARELFDALNEALAITPTNPRAAPDRSGEVAVLRPSELGDVTVSALAKSNSPPALKRDVTTLSPAPPRSRRYVWLVVPIVALVAILVLAMTRSSPQSPTAPAASPPPLAVPSVAPVPSPTISAASSETAPVATASAPSSHPTTKPKTPKPSAAQKPASKGTGYDDIE